MMRWLVRSTASEVMGVDVLPPLLATIRREHPKLVLELALSNRAENLVRREADIAVRMARPTQNAFVAKKLGAVKLGFFAHRDYLAQHGAPRTMDELMRRHIIGFDADDRSARAVAPKGLRLDRNLFAVRSDNDLAQQAALRAGLGIGVMQHRLAALHSHLEPVLAKDFEFTLDVWLAMHEDQRASRLMRTVYDALADELSAWLKERPATSQRGG
jgi:DNA-binding transcriptional LysR family regulator